MVQPFLANQRILVIEDDLTTRTGIVMCLQKIPEGLRHAKGIGKIETAEAHSVEQAKQRLEDSEIAFDLVLLDLHLPQKEPGDDTEHLDNGHQLLSYIKESNKVKGTIIVSNFHDYDIVIKSIRGGALDFVAKGFGPFEVILQTPVLNALARLMAEESARIFTQRIRDLVPYAGIGLAHSFKMVFSNLLQGVTEATASIQKYAHERYGLDSENDLSDSLVVQLHRHQEFVKQAQKEWRVLEGELAQGGNEREVSSVGTMLRGLKESLLPSLIVRKVSFNLPEASDLSVQTYERDVELVLREIIVGILSELLDYGVDREINISVTNIMAADKRATVEFRDNLPPISEEKMKAINDGERILPDANFGRIWGLSVAQHIALRGGGELKVGTEFGRNVITYHIPLAD